MKKDGIAKNTMVLVIMTLILGVILGSVHYVTEKPIAAQEKKQHDEALIAVMPDDQKDAEFETVDLAKDGTDQKIKDAIAAEGLTAESIDEMNIAKDSSGKEEAYVFTVTTTEGYGGTIQFVLGVDTEGAITGISFLSISETAGLGMRWAQEPYISRFDGKKGDKLTLVKTTTDKEDEVEAISGSTVTSNAITNGVNAALAAYKVYTEGGAAK
jgi:electron transport complex protein RnfG